MNRKLQSGTIELPPEGERSPSPPPVYDVMGMRCGARSSAGVAGECAAKQHAIDVRLVWHWLLCRLNTREVRYKEKLVKTRNQLIEQLIQKDPTYKPPSGAVQQPCCRLCYCN